MRGYCTATLHVEALSVMETRKRSRRRFDRDSESPTLGAAANSPEQLRVATATATITVPHDAADIADEDPVEATVSEVAQPSPSQVQVQSTHSVPVTVGFLCAEQAALMPDCISPMQHDTDMRDDSHGIPQVSVGVGLTFQVVPLAGPLVSQFAIALSPISHSAQPDGPDVAYVAQPLAAALELGDVTILQRLGVELIQQPPADSGHHDVAQQQGHSQQLSEADLYEAAEATRVLAAEILAETATALINAERSNHHAALEYLGRQWQAVSGGASGPRHADSAMTPVTGSVVRLSSIELCMRALNACMEVIKIERDICVKEFAATRKKLESHWHHDASGPTAGATGTTVSCMHDMLTRG